MQLNLPHIAHQNYQSRITEIFLKRKGPQNQIKKKKKGTNNTYTPELKGW